MLGFHYAFPHGIIVLSEKYIYIYIYFLEVVVFLLCPYSMGETVGY